MFKLFFAVIAQAVSVLDHAVGIRAPHVDGQEIVYDICFGSLSDAQRTKPATYRWVKLSFSLESKLCGQFMRPPNVKRGKEIC